MPEDQTPVRFTMTNCSTYSTEGRPVVTVGEDCVTIENCAIIDLETIHPDRQKAERMVDLFYQLAREARHV